MAYLPLANILHHKLRSSLSALGIGIAVCMLVTLTGLTRGSLQEIAQRWESVDAHVIVYPDVWDDDLVTISGVGLPDRLAGKLSSDHADIVQQVVPVFLWRVHLGGQGQTAVGVDRDDWPALTGQPKPGKGRLFAPKGDWRRFTRRLAEAGSANGPIDITPGQLAEAGWLELVIDSRLARAGGYRVGQSVRAANHQWKIVGIVPAGGMARVYMPRRTAQYLFGGASHKSTLLLVKLRPRADAGKALRVLGGQGRQAVRIEQYSSMLRQKFSIMFRYVDAVNAIALFIAFLFIMITLYTMVLERTREIAILKASGASNAFLIRQVLAESLLLTAAGTVVGGILTVLASHVIELCQPLLTVTVEWRWIATAIGLAAGGALASGMYPAWRATRVDMTEALNFE